MTFSAPAHVASQIGSAVAGLFRRGTVSSSTGLASTTIAYADQSYPVVCALVPYAIGEVPTVNDEAIVAQIQGQPVLLGKVLRSGLTPAYSPVPVVTSLPTASATYRGVLLRTAGASGTADGVYACVKSSADTYSWVRVDNAASAYGVLGTATNGSSQSGITSDTAITSMSIVVTSPPSGYLRFTITLPLQDQLTGGGNGAACRVSLKQNGTAIKTFDRVFPAGLAINQYDSCTWSWVITAAGGTYALSVQSLDSGTGTTKVNSGGKFVIEAVNAP